METSLTRAESLTYSKQRHKTDQPL